MNYYEIRGAGNHLGSGSYYYSIYIILKRFLRLFWKLPDPLME